MVVSETGEVVTGVVNGTDFTDPSLHEDGKYKALYRVTSNN